MRTGQDESGPTSSTRPSACQGTATRSAHTDAGSHTPASPGAPPARWTAARGCGPGAPAPSPNLLARPRRQACLAAYPPTAGAAAQAGASCACGGASGAGR